MITKVYTNPDIFKIDVPLPDNPLRNLNSYVIKVGDESLIIDTGFNRPECLKAIREGFAELAIDFSKTSLFLTHLHADHVGLACTLMKDTNRPIYMSHLDYEYFINYTLGDQWTKTEEKYETEGMPKEYTTILRNTNPARSFAPSGAFEAIPLEDRQTISIGDYTFTCILVPGHTPGQMCLYLEKEQLLFTADHILFDITPNITSWLDVADSLGDYIESLHKIQGFPIKTALPAHRKNDIDVYERIQQILSHHKYRLENTIDILVKEPALNSYEIAARMKWSMRGKCWEEFPLSQRWFAVGETMAHLDFLLVRGLIKQKEGDINTYTLGYDGETCKKMLDGFKF